MRWTTPWAGFLTNFQNESGRNSAALETSSVQFVTFRLLGVKWYGGHGPLRDI